ncbi:MAG: hypothetical protein WB424_16510 [Terracidiphilus sp.]
MTGGFGCADVLFLGRQLVVESHVILRPQQRGDDHSNSDEMRELDTHGDSSSSFKKGRPPQDKREEERPASATGYIHLMDFEICNRRFLKGIVIKVYFFGT